jgi:hypothetical protein
MIIGFDLRPINTGEKSGVEEYTVNLLKHLFFIDKKNEYKLFINSFAPPKLNFRKLRRFPNISIHNFSYPNKLLDISFTFFRTPKIDRMLRGVDIFFSPNIIFTTVSKACKHIITFHDLSFDRHPEFFSLRRRLWHTFVLPKREATQSAGIIAVSESTRNDLNSLYALDLSKISVMI